MKNDSHVPYVRSIFLRNQFLQHMYVLTKIRNHSHDPDMYEVVSYNIFIQMRNNLITPSG